MSEQDIKELRAIDNVPHWVLRTTRMDKVPPEYRGRVFQYLFIPIEIVIFAFVGWIIGLYLFSFHGEMLGMLMGTIIGTLAMFVTLFYLAVKS